jgi:hypothetical protein
VSAVMRSRLLTISVIRLGEMPIARASWFDDRPYSARNSSFNMSPGVTGLSSRFGTAISSMVIRDIQPHSPR